MEINLSNFNKKLNGARALVLALGLMLAAGLGFEARNIVFAQQPQQVQQAPLPSPADLSRTFVNISKAIKPAVVNIDVVEKAKRSAMRLPEGFPQIPGFGEPR